MRLYLYAAGPLGAAAVSLCRSSTGRGVRINKVHFGYTRIQHSELRIKQIMDAQRLHGQTFTMSYSLQIVVDCTNPHELADWWAETMGWQVEPSDEAFIRSMVAKGFATEEQTTLHHGILVWADGQAINPNADTSAGAPRILFQRTDQEKRGKNRIHWDVRIGDDDKMTVRTNLEARGATFLWEASQGPHLWFTMADPEGNEFCIS